MSRYLEFDSTFRDRNKYPFPASFDILLSQSGQRTKYTAEDPISYAYPSFVFNNSFNYLVSQPTIECDSNPPTTIPTVNNLTLPNRLVLTITNPIYAFIQIDSFYEGASLILYNNSVIQSVHRIDIYKPIDSTHCLVAITPSISITQLNQIGNRCTITNPTVITKTYNFFFVPAGTIADNGYVGLYLYNETISNRCFIPTFRAIINYDGVLKCVSVENSIYPIWRDNDVYSIRRELPIKIGELVVNTQNTLQSIILQSMDDVGTYERNFIRICTPYDQNEYVFPTVGTSSTITTVELDCNLLKCNLYPTLKNTISTVSTLPTISSSRIYEILPFTRDNAVPFVFIGSSLSQQELVCYELQLISLILPNIPLRHYPGSRIVYYPYLYIELTNLNTPISSNIMYSNNPNSSKMIFRAPITDISNQINTSFIKLTGNGMIQTIKFRPNDNFHFAVYTPDGNLFETQFIDSISPAPPLPICQISVCFSCKRILI